LGNFNAACSISSISIGGGDSVVYIPLEISKYPYKISDGNNFLIYSHCFYSPVTLPIFGDYDDYGRVENIKRDTNVDIIEAHFDEKIEDICGMNKHDIKPISSGMFIHREIFDILVEKCSQIDEWGKKDSESGKNYLSNQFDKFMEHIRQAKDMEKKYKIYSKARSNRGWEIWLTQEAHNVFNFRHYYKFRKIYFPLIENGKFKEELIQFILFESGMFAVNRFYFPAMNGYQCGNHFASKLLYRKAASIVAEYVKERK